MQAGSYYLHLTDEESEFYRREVTSPDTDGNDEADSQDQPYRLLLRKQFEYLSNTQFLQSLWSHNPVSSAWLLKTLFPVWQCCREETGGRSPSPWLPRLAGDDHDEAGIVCGSYESALLVPAPEIAIQGELGDTL